MKRKISLALALATIFCIFTGCGKTAVDENTTSDTTSNTTTETTTELTTIATTAEATSATDEETEESTTKAPETTKKQVYEPVENTKKPTEAPVNTPPGSGLDTWDDGPGDPNEYVQDPNTDAQYWVDKEVEELGENLNWELY